MTLEELGEITSGDKPVLIKFYADWCMPCKMLTPVIKSVEMDYKDKVEFINVNVDESPELVNKFRIRGIPRLLLIINDEETFIEDKSMAGISKAIFNTLTSQNNEE